MSNPTSSASTQPSSAYIFALSAGATGLPFLGIGLGGSLIGRAGGDPVRAFDVDGMVMFLLAFAIGFAIRLIFWPPAPPSLRSAVRTIVTIIFAIGIPPLSPASFCRYSCRRGCPTGLSRYASPPWLSFASQAPYCGWRTIVRKESEPPNRPNPRATPPRGASWRSPAPSRAG